MADDARRFEAYESGFLAVRPMLRYYVWAQSSITLGYRQKHLQANYLSQGYLPHQVAVRPTGGGVVEHQPGDLTYALYLPKDVLPKGSMDDVFRWLSQPLLSALGDWGVEAYMKLPVVSAQLSEMCFEQAAGYELSTDGGKLLGQAQRMGRRVFLAQGTFQGLNIKQAQYENFVRHWGVKIEEAQRVWGANSRASALGIPSSQLV